MRVRIRMLGPKRLDKARWPAFAEIHQEWKFGNKSRLRSCGPEMLRNHRNALFLLIGISPAEDREPNAGQHPTGLQDAHQFIGKGLDMR